MALPQQGTETTTNYTFFVLFTDVLMALPQQGTETIYNIQTFIHFILCVNGLTPTGDGNRMLVTLLVSHLDTCVNGLTPTGDGNLRKNQLFNEKSVNVLMALPQQGTETIRIRFYLL